MTKTAAARQFGRLAAWTESRLADGAIPVARDGPALLKPAHAIVLAHAGRTSRMQADDLVLIDQALPLQVEGEAGWTADLLDFAPRAAAIRIEAINRHFGVPLDGDHGLAGFIRRFWSIGRDLHSAGQIDDLNTARLLDLICDLTGQLIAEVADDGLRSHTRAMIARAELIIATRFAETDFAPAGLAAAMGISPRHLSSLFSGIGTTPTKAILLRRLSHAKALLDDSVNRRREIANIALACGFGDQSYFARCFQREHGMSPRNYRKLHRSG